MSRKSSIVYVNEVKATTDYAALCDLEFEDERAECWLPLSQCPGLEDCERGDGQFEIEVPNWILVEKGLLDYKS